MTPRPANDPNPNYYHGRDRIKQLLTQPVTTNQPSGRGGQPNPPGSPGVPGQRPEDYTPKG
jgi:hypothetical protein